MVELITGFGVEQDEKQNPNDEQIEQYLTFKVANELFAVGILEVSEIIEFGSMTPVPMMPNFIRGVINLRGQAVPVVDLSARLGKGQQALNRRSCIILVQGTGKQPALPIGMLVDSVDEIVEIEQACIHPPPAFGESVDTQFIKAMARTNELFFILLDIKHLLSHVGEIAAQQWETIATHHSTAFSERSMTISSNSE
ncbi:purine-binding chemotaxis protein CheW [Vibrio navarrensis]|uniref:chemotaxis protein CheW n=1 Tax=Vibrio navarrensis TaxID=29495 RepID=UPI001302DABC|nr:chemotaxis protein CheW [Vibrio navarrensis]EJL6393627.1 purine-binding chemotaxis protein CheW [Vibrio navarrensis]EJL6399472.1 purine-binding chemotaxis protein CheW [Vibrio navarrensis]EJL6565875.1 purine-binding chemotaxis protein CheW [Vibrio navarrensis]MBH9738636.1 chemotaxis protein CheW [Vibrio navarrensis]